MEKLKTIAIMATGLLLPIGGAQAQEADGVTLAILRECARIADIATRVACYDRNIGVSVATGAATTATAPTGFGANQLPQPRVAAADQFGANQLATPRRERQSRQDSLTVTLAAANQRAPGLWLLTLEDGAQWEFVDAVPLSYDPPRKGSVVELNMASMGSYILRHAGQQGVRIRRVR